MHSMKDANENRTAFLRGKEITRNPELNLFFFSFLVNFFWEMWQVPYYLDMAQAPHFEAVRICTQASIGDGLISVIAFWCAAVVATRKWYLKPGPGSFFIYLFTGVVITVLLEWLATGPLQRWDYAASMPRLPLLGTGLLPLLQWLVLPPLTLALLRRQLAGIKETEA